MPLTYAKDSKFFVTQVLSGYPQKPQVQFASHVPQVLSIDDAKQLIAEVKSAIGESNQDSAELAKVKTDFAAFAAKADAKVGALTKQLAAQKASK